jgi:hypothetical protein
LKNLNYDNFSEKDPDKVKKSLYTKFDNALYQFTIMEIVSYITNLCIIQREVPPATSTEDPLVPTAEKSNSYYKHLERLVTTYKAKQDKTYKPPRAAGDVTSCLQQGSKFNNTNTIINEILGKIYGKNIDFDNLTRAVLNKSPAGGDDFIKTELAN